MFKAIINLFKTIFSIYPSVGDTVKVAVGFSSHPNEGVVRRVCNDETGRYCWIDQYTKDGKWYHSFTASFSYCMFEYL